MGSRPGRQRRRAAAPALVLAVAAVGAACGAGGGDVTDAGPAPTREPGAAVGAQVDGATATVSIYLTRGDKVSVVKRNVPRVPAIGAEAMKALIAGPTPEEAGAGFGTAIPAGTRFLGLTITDGVARVDLSRSFGEGAGDEGYTVRLAQIACTLDEFDTVRGVRFALAGTPVGVQNGSGAVTEEPVTCGGYGALTTTPVSAPASGIWPYTSAAEADAAAGRGDRSFTDPRSTAREFAVRYLGMADAAVFDFHQSEPGAGEVGLGVPSGEGGATAGPPRMTMTVVVRQLGSRSSPRPWTVVAASAPNIEVQSPQPLQRASSPLRLTGRASAFEGNVQVEIREDGMPAGASLGETFVTGRGDGQLGPFSGELTFRSPAKPGGAVLFVDRSAADGSVQAATIVRVVF